MFFSKCAALREELLDWTDFATAAFAVGKYLGVYNPIHHLADVREEIEGDSSIALGLTQVLHGFLTLGVIERDKAGNFRWKQDPES